MSIFGSFRDLLNPKCMATGLIIGVLVGLGLGYATTLRLLNIPEYE